METVQQQLKQLGPYLVLTGMLTLAAALLLMKFTGSAMVAPPVVSFDVIKYTNSQKAIASTYLKRNGDIGEANTLLLNLPERTKQSIAKIAGDGTLVVIKQAVVQGQMADITDAVLSDLGLPTNVPTADGTAYSLNIAPTVLSMLPAITVKEEQPTVAVGSKAELP